jgi:transcriptional regulator with XRE-family HTH domain
MKELSKEVVEFAVGRLRKLRDARNVPQKQLEEFTGAGQSTISRIFSGAQQPTTEMLEKLSRAFGLTLSSILEEIDREKKEIIGYLATPLTAVAGNAKAEAELKAVVQRIKKIAGYPEFSEPGFEIYWPGDHTHPIKNADLKASLVYLKDRSTASTYDFLVIFCGDPSYGVGQENEIATQAGTPAIRLVPPKMSRMMAGSFISSRDVEFQGSLSTEVTFDEESLKGALHWVLRMYFKHRALYPKRSSNGFGDRLRHLISDRSGDYQSFADDLGVALHYVHALMDEPLSVSNPSSILLKRVASLLGVSVGHLVGEEEDSDPVWIESSASWNSWVTDGKPRDAGIAVRIKALWRDNYKATKMEENISSARKPMKTMRTKDWENLYQKETKGDRVGRKSLF